MTVALLLDKAGAVLSVYLKTAQAEAKRDKYNAEPVLDGGEPDPKAPYRTEEWRVQDGASWA